MGFFDVLAGGAKAYANDLNEKRDRASRMSDRQLARTLLHSSGNMRVACAQELDARGYTKYDIHRLAGE